MNQWAERIAEFLPGARIGRIQGEIIDIEDKDIVLGMLQSISTGSGFFTAVILQTNLAVLFINSFFL